MVVPIIALLSVPIILSAVALLLRQLRKLNEYSVACYVALATFIGYGTAVLTSGDGLYLLWSFTFIDWIIVIGLGFSSTYVQFCISRAAQYEEPAKLAVVNYFQSVFSLLMDLVVFGTLFSLQQFVGIIILLTAFSSMVTVAVRNNYLSKK
jgi:drug/metabolite transporter (DMT)-like permease